MQPIRIALAAYVPALTRNGRPAAIPKRRPPSGPATRFSISVSPPVSQPLARSSLDGGTTAGSIRDDDRVAGARRDEQGSGDRCEPAAEGRGRARRPQLREPPAEPRSAR